MRDFERYQRPAPRNVVSDALVELDDVAGINDKVEIRLYEHELFEEEHAS
jgi:hypothetical protein